MAEFPASPIPAHEFFESFLPEAYLEAPLPEGMADLNIELGVELEGEGGGQWLLHLVGRSLVVGAGSHKGAVVTLLQSVDDWRGALWEGRGGSLGRAATALFRPGTHERVLSAAAPRQSALDQLQTLSGSLKLVVSGGKGGAWSLAVLFGPGTVAEEPTTTLTVSEKDADLIVRGELDPVQAFVSGRIEIAGDISLLLQLQAVVMQAAGT